MTSEKDKTKEEIIKIKSDIFDIIRKQDELIAQMNKLNSIKSEKVKILLELEKQL